MGAILNTHDSDPASDPNLIVVRRLLAGRARKYLLRAAVAVDNGPTVIPLACAHDRSAEQLVQAAQRFTQILRDRGRFLPSPAARLAQFRKGARGIVIVPA
jgi:hypothetical protein